MTTRKEQSRSPEREVVVLMSDMVNYSRATAAMRPEAVRDFVTKYHTSIEQLVCTEVSEPVEVEPLAGDGALIVFDHQPGSVDREELCSRALCTALRLAEAIDDGRLPPTRMGLFLGDIIEARLGARNVKFGASFAMANRLEELCGYFGISLLFDENVACYQRCDVSHTISIGKITLQSFSHPIQVYTIYRPGVNNIHHSVDPHLLNHFITTKNAAMDRFCGRSSESEGVDFPRVREMLVDAQTLFVRMSGREDRAVDRILEYIRETPAPEKEFQKEGMRLSEKRRDSLGARLFHLSRELLKALNHEFYHALVVDTGWEKYFKLEWRKKGETIITIHDTPDGVYFIDRGEVVTINEEGEQIAILSAGTIFGEMAYFNQQKRRTATVVAATDLVIRRIASEDFEKLPVIMKIFEKIAQARA